MEVVVESREYSLLASTTLTESGVLHRSANFVSPPLPLALAVALQVQLPTPSRSRPRVGNFLNASELFVLQVLPYN